MKRKKMICPNCLSSISLSNIPRHQKSKSCQHGGKGRSKVSKYNWEVWKTGDDIYTLPCGYTGSKTACRNKLINQQVLSRKGPSGNFSAYQQQIKNGVRFIYNKGGELTIEHREKISSSMKSYIMKNGPYKFTDEQKIAMSKKRNEYLILNPDQHPNVKVAGNRNKMTYPEQVAFDWFKSKGIEAKHNKNIGRFYPDFIVGNVIIEIDGERWHSSIEQKNSDQKRDNLLSNMGYIIYRIPSKEKIETRLHEIFD